jgi:hypothetical protein
LPTSPVISGGLSVDNLDLAQHFEPFVDLVWDTTFAVYCEDVLRLSGYMYTLNVFGQKNFIIGIEVLSIHILDIHCHNFAGGRPTVARQGRRYPLSIRRNDLFQDLSLAETASGGFDENDNSSHKQREFNG